MADYKHLILIKERLQNPRRSAPPPYFYKRKNKAEHGRVLLRQLPNIVESQQERPKSIPNSLVLKLPFKGFVDFEQLQRHGVSFITMEEENVCVVFADERGVAIFTEHLQKFVDNDTTLSYAQLFEAIDKIANWTRENRLGWSLKKKGLPQAEQFILDVELWPLGGGRIAPQRQELCNGFEVWLSEEKLVKIDHVNHDDLLMYRVQVTPAQAEQLFTHNDVRYVDLPPSTGVTYQQLNLDVNTLPKNIPAPPRNAAKICILDSGINSNHPLLKSAIADGQSYIEGKDETDETGHGTHVAGIALYGDVDASNRLNYWNPEIWLLNGRILNDENEFDVYTIENILEDAVHYFVTNYQCKIFNLSIGNENAPYNGTHIKGIAYVIDKLARKFDVLFIVSAGNFRGSDELEIPKNSWRSEYPGYLLDEVSAIIDPATALNTITVGSYALHELTSNAHRYSPDLNDLPVAKAKQPSPFTRHGPSVKKALKPELIAHGGNIAVDIKNEKQYIPAKRRGLGVISLNHDFMGKTLLSESSGTSFSAPYISHLAARLQNDYPDASANLLRALLLNQSSMPRSVTDTFSNELSKNHAAKKRLSPSREVAGYGKVNEDILFRSREQAVILYIEDKIEDNTYQFFEIPLPEEYFQGRTRTREIRVTLSYMPAVKRTRIEYRGSRMWFRLVKGRSLEQIQKHFNKNEADIQNMGEYLNNREIGAEIRDRGTVQSDIWRLKRPNKNEKWFLVVLRNDYAWAEDLCRIEEPYALVVR